MHICDAQQKEPIAEKSVTSFFRRRLEQIRPNEIVAIGPRCHIFFQSQFAFYFNFEHVV